MSETYMPRLGGLLSRRPDATADTDPARNTSAVTEVVAQAKSAATFLKALGHEGRLLILCHLLAGEKSVSELEVLLSSRQAAVSQQLARLRLEGMVQSRREGQQIHYSISDPRVAEVVVLLNRLFGVCDKAGGQADGGQRGA